MATQTIERQNELVEENVSTLVLTPEMESPMSYDFLVIPGDAEVVEEAELRSSFPAVGIRLLAKLTRPVVAAYDWMGGPPKTGQQRHRQVMAQRRTASTW